MFWTKLSFGKFVACFIVILAAAHTHAAILTFDGLSNGQKIDTAFEASPLVDITSSGDNQGAAIFDSDPAGPNSGGRDPDLLVDLGNILILQSNDETAMTGDAFDTPNDSSEGGILLFSFLDPVEPLSVDLADIDSGAAVTITLTDGGTLTRTYEIPDDWTNELPTPNGFDLLDLTTLVGQIGEGGSMATAMEDVGFDSTNVVTMEVHFSGSAALDNLSFIPEPGGLAGLLLGGLAFLTRTRRRQS